MGDLALERNIVLHVIPAWNGERALGFTAVAIESDGDRVRYMELGHFTEAGEAELRLHDIRRYIIEWETVMDVRRDLDKVAAMFSRHDGLGGEWQRLSKHESARFDMNSFALNYGGGLGFHPDLTPLERIEMNAPKVLFLIERRLEAVREDALRQLTAEVGRRLGEPDAMDLVARWGPSRIGRDLWSIEIVPAVGDEGESVGFSVVGLLHDCANDRALVFDLMEPDMEEVDARVNMGGLRMSVEAMIQVPFHPAHRDGLRTFFDKIREQQQVEAWSPFWVEGDDLDVFLAWGKPLPRGSYCADGTRRTDVPLLLAAAFGPLDMDRVHELRISLGCEDRE